MTTSARPTSLESAHWYRPDGTTCHTVIAKGTGLPRQTTLADAKKLGLLPSVSGILRVLDKPALNNWKVEQAVLAAATTPRIAGEELDAFIDRVMSVDAEAEGQKARDFGTLIHSRLEAHLRGGMEKWKLFPPDDVDLFCQPVLDLVASLGKPIATERIVVGDGYAGTLDLLLDTGKSLLVVDFKTTKAKNLPMKSYTEHRLALSAYAAAIPLHERPLKPIDTANIYISSITHGMISMCRNDDWLGTFEQGFKPILAYWRWNAGHAP